MSLLVPFGLLGLLTLPVVVVLHFLRERRKKKVLSSLALWRFLEQEVRGSRFSRIPITWLLLLHLLIATILSLAVARPQLALNMPVRDARHLVLLVDVSTSMRSRDVTPDRFSQARLAAVSLLNGLEPGDIATVLAFGSGARWVGDTRQMNLPELVERLTALQAGETGQALDLALVLAQTALDGELPGEFHIFSDAAFETEGYQNFEHPLQWHIVGRESNNQAVISIKTQILQEEKLQVYARLANYSNADSSRVLTLLIDDKPVDSTTLFMPTNSEVVQVWRLNGAPGVLSVVLMGGDYLKEDDSASIGVRARRSVQVLLVRDQALPAKASSVVTNPVERALTSIPNVALRKVTLAEYSPATPADLVVFQGVLPRVWPAKPVLVIQPPETGGDDSLFTFQGRAEIALDAALQVSGQEFLLQGVDFGGVRWASAFHPRDLPQDFETLLAAGGYPLLVKGYVAGAPLLALFVDLDRSNLTKHPAFPLLLVNIIENIRTSQLTTNIQAGEPLRLPAPQGLASLQLLSAGSTDALKFAGQWPETWNDTLEPGAYRVIVESMAGDFETYVIGVNAGDFAESNIQPQLDGLTNQVPSAGGQMEIEKKIELAPWLLAAAVLLLFVEAVLAWR